MPQPYIIFPSQGSAPEDEWVRLGIEAHQAGRLPEAQRHYSQCLRLNPRHAQATHNLAIVFSQSNMLNEALLTMERAEMFDGHHALIQSNYALVCLEADRIDEALTHAKKAVDMDPDVNSLMALAMVSTTAGHAPASLPLYDKILEKEPKHPAAGPNSCFVQTLAPCSPEDLRRSRARWLEANKYTGEIAPHDNDRNLDRPLRVGYVGGDFKQHSASFIFGGVVTGHSKDVVPFFYSSLPVDPAVDPRTKVYRDVAGERWRDISTLQDDDEVARLVRRDRIDILVDLAGHTAGGRLPLFLRKPAPVQVTAWGFAHSTALPTIRYFFADPVTVPLEERHIYVEKIWDLPCIVTMREPVEYQLNGASSAPVKRNGFFSFGTFARYEKMSDDCLKMYAEILRRVPDSRMTFKDAAYRRPYSIRRIMSIMKDVEPERLLFSIATNHVEHMLAYQAVDLCLDPTPHGGGAVFLETCWMGVPTITLYGTQPSGRTGASVLTCMGRTDWIAYSFDEYVEKAVEWAGRTKELADSRKTLRNEFLESPVMKGYVPAVERAYHEIWKEWCQES